MANASARTKRMGPNIDIGRIGASRLVSRQVARVLDSRIEHKRIVDTTAAFDWATAGVVSLLSTDIAQGDNINNRSGDIIRPKRLVFRLLSFDLTATVGTACRVIIFQDSMCNGSTPAVTDVLDTAEFNSPYNPVTRQSHRFKYLLDHRFTMVDGTHTQVVEVERSFALKGTIHYVGSASGAASAGRNTLYVLFLSDTQSAGGKIYQWSYDLEFTDA